MGKLFFNKQKGFTLIELMIVVAIIGLLATIAGPAFERYQSRSRQTEAKLSLAASYNNEKAFYGEYTAYIPALDAIGFSVDGAKRFYQIGWSATYTGAVTGYGGSVSLPSIARTGVATNFSLACATNVSALSASPAATANDAQQFQVFAAGQLRSNAAGCDVWRIDEVKALTNTTINLQWMRWTIFFALFLLTAASLWQRFIPASDLRVRTSYSYNEGYMSLNPETVDLVSVGYQRLLSSTLWLRFLQNTPPKKIEPGMSSWIFHDLLSISVLDPEFYPIYTDAAIFLSVITEDKQGAEEIFLRGTKQFP